MSSTTFNNLPVFTVDFQLQSHTCHDLSDCKDYARHLLGLGESTRKYIEIGTPVCNQLITACIDLRNPTYDDYIAKVKKRYKGNVIRGARKSDKEGFICKPFLRKLFIPDIVEINQSKEVRSCGPMTSSYLRTVEDLGGAPERYEELEMPGCPSHYAIFWGIFKPETGYSQGKVVTNEKLLAYIRLRRIGNFGTYSLIIGHGDYLQFGIMYRLHFAIMEWLCQKDNIYGQGLDILIYAAYYDGSAGLNLWKKKTCFDPAYLITSQKV